MMSCVDIVLATCNGAGYLKEQIASLLQQSYGDIRIIATDDASDDGTTAILQQIAQAHPDKVLLKVNEKRKGVLRNFDRGLKESDAPYVMLSDQDDVWHSGKVATTLSAMKALEELWGSETPLLVHSDLNVVDAALGTIAPSFWRYAKLTPDAQAQTLNRLLVQNVVTGCTAMANRALVDMALPIAPEAIMHDWWLALVAASFGRIDAIAQATVDYRQHGSNTLGAKKLWSLDSVVRYRDHSKKMQKLKHGQAQAFYERYHTHLTDEQRALVEKFLALPTMTLLQQKRTIISEGLWKNGWQRNALYLLMPYHP